MNYTTEMPEKTEGNGVWPEKISIDESIWIPQSKAIEDTGEMISYTRTDTIPSKAEVAREFMDAVEKRTRLGLLTVQDLGDVLKEWDNAESK